MSGGKFGNPKFENAETIEKFKQSGSIREELRHADESLQACIDECRSKIEHKDSCPGYEGQRKA